MPEYVYAVHDFSPEHEDEIEFRAGDRIEVIEKDDMYGDGWWQGKNLFGKIGLFPQSYTTSDPNIFNNSTPQPAPQTNGNGVPEDNGPTTLQTLKEDSEANDEASEAVKKGEHNGVMKATMTDVQEAIEQLGRNDRDGTGSFSFASTHTTDRELESDRETDASAGPESWHKEARSNLAEKARQQQEQLRKEQEAYDAELRLHAAVLPEHIPEPPIEFDVSDESEGEEDLSPVEPGPAADTLFPRRDHAHISEEEEEDEESVRQQHIKNTPMTPRAMSHDTEPQSAVSGTKFSNPWNEVDTDEKIPETARQSSFPTETKIEPVSQAPETDIATAVQPHPGIASLVQLHSQSSPPSAQIQRSTSPTSTPVTKRSSREQTTFSRPSTADPEIRAMGSPSALPSPPTSQKGASNGYSPKSPSKPPSDWTVEDVVDWARSKGFDSSVCDKFVEHEITGDVLLELDANILKTELEIHAFGKRTRIMKEITELRRPPSAMSSVHLAPQGHVRTVSQSMSLPGSAHHSLSSPMTINGVLSPESPPFTSDLSSTLGASVIRRDSDPGSLMRASETERERDQESTTANESLTGASGASLVGLGLGVVGTFANSVVGSDEKIDQQKKSRPAYLNLSSDKALNKARSAKFSPSSAMDESIREERSALSDTDSTQALDSRNRRRKLFGRSTGSSNSDQKEGIRRDSKEHQPLTPASGSISVPESPSTKRGSTEDGVKNSQRRKRSVDGSKTSDRLSIFGGNLSLSRSRKPPPRVQSAYAHDDLATEKHSRSLSRLYLGNGSRKASSKSQATIESTSHKGDNDKDSTDSRVLRKRTSSMIDSNSVPGLPGVLKSGQSVLEQIGAPDHNGWMRKKGEHYNTWKLRYFVLKGPHLYYLRSNSKAETKIKGYINIIGYKVIVDENINPGKYGFRLIHESDRTHYFCSDESITVREWMKALMKATIGRDYTKPVISSCNIPTIPLSVAQTMNPAPRPPSPSQRDATQKALRRENPNQLSSRDARILMGLPQGENGYANGAPDRPPRPDDNLFSTLDTLPESKEEQIPIANLTSAPPPTRPSRETRRTSVPPVDAPNPNAEIIRWANSHLPQSLQISENGEQIYSGLALYRLAEAIKGKSTEPPVPDSAFPTGPNDDRLDGLFKLFDFFLDNDIRMGSVSINDVRQGRTDKIIHLLRSLQSWEEKRRVLARSGGRSTAHAGSFMDTNVGPSAVRAW